MPAASAALTSGHVIFSNSTSGGLPWASTVAALSASVAALRPSVLAARASVAAMLRRRRMKLSTIEAGGGLDVAIVLRLCSMMRRARGPGKSSGSRRRGHVATAGSQSGQSCARGLDAALAGLAPSSAARSLSRVRTKHRAFFRYDGGRGVTSRFLLVGLAVGLLCGVSACAATGRRASRSAPSAENCSGDDVLEVANESGWSVDVYAYSGASSGGILIGSVGSGTQTLPLAGTWAERKQVGFVARLNGKEVYPVRFRRRCDRDAS